MGRTSEMIKYHRLIDSGADPTEKPCRGCGDRWLPLSSFGRDKSRKDGLCNLCRDCARTAHRAWVSDNRERARASARERAARVPLEKRQDHHRKHRYGMVPGQYERMRAAQGGRCAVCQQVPSKALVVDHDHTSGRVRGLLCYACNRGLHMLDTPGRLEAALAYLKAATSEAHLAH